MTFVPAWPIIVGDVPVSHVDETMTGTMLRLLSRLVAWLPLSVNRRLGAALGHLAWWSGQDARYDTLINLQLCFPDLPGDQRQALARSSLVDTGRMLTESAWVWLRPPRRSLERVRGLEQLDRLRSALAGKEGAIIASPHVGNWELCGAVMATVAPFTYFYRAHRKPDIDAWVVDCRANLGGTGVPLSTGGIREGLKCLKRGELLGILPDQEPDAGVFAPFFAEPALTMTLISKLARRSRAPVFFCCMERDLKAGGWQFHLFEADRDIASADESRAAQALNGSVERCAAINPPQYLWDYRRFATLQDLTRRDYRGERQRLRLATGGAKLQTER